jgi:hypothetical protein
MEHSRRNFLLGAGAALLPVTAQATPRRPAETVYRFATDECEGHLTVQFFDKEDSKGFWFRDDLTTRRFCLSGSGQQNEGCLSQFSGSIAIAVYHFRPHRHISKSLSVRELVRTIDQDFRLAARSPFERTLPMQGGVVSDIQAFGYDPQHGGNDSLSLPPWCLLRQDLYINGGSEPFLLLHWKHTLNAITLIDVIPGERTQLLV